MPYAPLKAARFLALATAKGFRVTATEPPPDVARAWRVSPPEREFWRPSFTVTWVPGDNGGRTVFELCAPGTLKTRRVARRYAFTLVRGGT